MRGYIACTLSESVISKVMTQSQHLLCTLRSIQEAFCSSRTVARQVNADSERVFADPRAGCHAKRC